MKVGQKPRPLAERLYQGVSILLAIYIVLIIARNLLKVGDTDLAQNLLNVRNAIGYSLAVGILFLLQGVGRKPSRIPFSLLSGAYLLSVAVILSLHWTRDNPWLLWVMTVPAHAAALVRALVHEELGPSTSLRTPSGLAAAAVQLAWYALLSSIAWRLYLPHDGLPLRPFELATILLSAVYSESFYRGLATLRSPMPSLDARITVVRWLAGGVLLYFGIAALFGLFLPGFGAARVAPAVQVSFPLICLFAVVAMPLLRALWQAVGLHAICVAVSGLILMESRHSDMWLVMALPGALLCATQPSGVGRWVGNGLFCAVIAYGSANASSDPTLVVHFLMGTVTYFVMFQWLGSQLERLSPASPKVPLKEEVRTLRLSSMQRAILVGCAIFGLLASVIQWRTSGALKTATVMATVEARQYQYRLQRDLDLIRQILTVSGQHPDSLATLATLKLQIPGLRLEVLETAPTDALRQVPSTAADQDEGWYGPVRTADAPRGQLMALSPARPGQRRLLARLDIGSWVDAYRPTLYPLDFDLSLRDADGHTLSLSAPDPGNAEGAARQWDARTEVVVAADIALLPERRQAPLLGLTAVLAALLGAWVYLRSAERELEQATREASLRELQQSQALLSESGNGMVLFAASGEVIYCNDAAGRIIEFPLDLLKSINALTDPVFQNLGWDRVFKETHESGVLHSFDWQGPNRLGQMLDFRVTFRRLNIGGRPCILSELIDRRELHREEAIRLRVEARYRSLFEGAVNSMLIIDGEDSRIVDANPAALAVLRWDRKDLVGQPAAVLGLSLLPLLKPDSREPLENREILLLRADGQTIVAGASLSLIDLDGRPGVFVAFRDLTESKALSRQSEILLQALDEGVDVALITDLDGHILHMNRMGRKSFGLSAEGPLVGLTISDITDPEWEKDRGAAGLQRVLRERVVEMTALWRSTTGKIIPLRLNIVRQDGPTPGESRIVTVGRDLRSSLARETALQAALEKAEAASIAKDQFLATMSHEIRTPLNAIYGFGQLLQGEIRDERQTRYISRVLDASQHLLRLINDILDFAKLDATSVELESKEITTRALCEEAMDFVRPACGEKGLKLELSLDPSVPATLMGDPTRLKQVLINLLANAAKFTIEGGISLSGRSDIGDKGRRWLHLDVTDSGIGIGADQLERIFAPFTQVDESSGRRYGGTGLGLAISKKLAERMGGQLTVRSEPGRGSTFTLSIPVA
ncbi:MAG: Autoinducer 2 sensor kinase/phosphatase LuxQ [Pseudomonadota bacterium]|jgi:PAS domain S-box-containing protein